MNGIDFFCGGGGMTRGLLNAGINVLFGLDCDPSCQTTYEINNNVPYICRDIRFVNLEDLVNRFPLLEDNDDLLMIGCAPCQPFSNQRNSDCEHSAVNLLDEFGRLVESFLPAHILIENVPGIVNRGQVVFRRFLGLLERLGYNYVYNVVNAKHFGIPQNRKRLLLIASRLFQPQIPAPTHGADLVPYITVLDVIGNYPPLAAGEEHPVIPNHKSANLSPINLQRIMATPHNGGGRISWPEHLMLKCHANGHKGHTDVYGRMAWEDVAPTLTSKCFSLSNGRFGHPEQNRAISFREAAALQTFNDEYVFFGNMEEMGRQIGNAVPVLLAEIMGQYLIAEHHHYLYQQ